MRFCRPTTFVGPARYWWVSVASSVVRCADQDQPPPRGVPWSLAAFDYRCTLTRGVGVIGTRPHPEHEVEVIVERDPVCGMEVDSNSAAGSVVHNGKTYYFCSTGCMRRFEEAPEQYAGKD